MTSKELEAKGWHTVQADAEYFVMTTEQVNYRWIEIGYDIPTQRLQVLKAHQHPTGFKTRATIYNGKCPDIETFKQLQILLEI